MTTIAVVATGAWFRSISAAATGSGTPPMRSPTRARSRAYRCSTASPAADRGRPQRRRSSQTLSPQRDPLTQPLDDAATRRRRAFAAGQALPAPRARATLSPATSPKTSITMLCLAPLAAHKLEIAGVLILIIGLGATGALLLAHGHRGLAAPRRSLVASTSQFAASDAQSVATQKRAMSLTVERLAAEQQAAERRQARARAVARRRARARAAARRRARIKAQQRPDRLRLSCVDRAIDRARHRRPVASSAADSTVSESSAASSPETSSAQSSTATSEPTTTSTAPSSSSSSSNSTNQSSSASKQPAFGSAGTLAPAHLPMGNRGRRRFA